MAYRIWFERKVEADLLPLIPSSVEMLGPGRDDDPLAGIETAQAALAARLAYNDQLFDQAPRLLGVFRTGIGYDSVDLEAATRRGIAACNVPEGPTVSTAEHSVALILAVAKKIKESGYRLRAGAGGYYSKHNAMELDGKTLGLVGFGRIARRVGTAAQGLGMKVLAYDPYLPAEAFPEDVGRAETLPELLAAGHVVSVHIPMSPENASMFDAAAFATMKKGAVFVNAARGGLVDQEALISALDSGHLFGAGLDVTHPEPLDPDHPLLHRTDVIVTPHIASSTPESRQRIFKAALDQAQMVLDGKRPPHLLNPSAWEGVLNRVNR
ncbi:MAG: hydroxyacid dehydrogenase [bacterium]|nr:hydroxyacid dehydrogenase [bacterium]MCY3653021.1 hydroxyacid dehydrogenase [bacterium]